MTYVPLRTFFLFFFALSGTLLAQAEQKSPVTASDYSLFLNDIAVVSDSHHFYDPKMEGDSESASIKRTGAPGNYHYEILTGRENVPINFVSEDSATAYSHWQHQESSLLCENLDSSLKSNKESFQLSISRGATLSLVTASSSPLIKKGSFDTDAIIVAGTISLAAFGSQMMLRGRVTPLTSPSWEEFQKAAFNSNYREDEQLVISYNRTSVEPASNVTRMLDSGDEDEVRETLITQLKKQYPSLDAESLVCRHLISRDNSTFFPLTKRRLCSILTAAKQSVTAAPEKRTLPLEFDWSGTLEDVLKESLGSHLSFLDGEISRDEETFDINELPAVLHVPTESKERGASSKLIPAIGDKKLPADESISYSEVRLQKRKFANECHLKAKEAWEVVQIRHEDDAATKYFRSIAEEKGREADAAEQAYSNEVEQEQRQRAALGFRSITLEEYRFFDRNILRTQESEEEWEFHKRRWLAGAEAENIKAKNKALSHQKTPKIEGASLGLFSWSSLSESFDTLKESDDKFISLKNEWEKYADTTEVVKARCAADTDNDQEAQKKWSSLKNPTEIDKAQKKAESLAEEANKASREATRLTELLSTGRTTQADVDAAIKNKFVAKEKAAVTKATLFSILHSHGIASIADAQGKADSAENLREYLAIADKAVYGDLRDSLFTQYQDPFLAHPPEQEAVTAAIIKEWRNNHIQACFKDQERAEAISQDSDEDSDEGKTDHTTSFSQDDEIEKTAIKEYQDLVRQEALNIVRARIPGALAVWKKRIAQAKEAIQEAKDNYEEAKNNCSALKERAEIAREKYATQFAKAASQEVAKGIQEGGSTLVETGLNVLQDGLTGAATGSPGGPIGSAVGAGIGASKALLKPASHWIEEKTNKYINAELKKTEEAYLSAKIERANCKKKWIRAQSLHQAEEEALDIATLEDQRLCAIEKIWKDKIEKANAAAHNQIKRTVHNNTDAKSDSWNQLPPSWRDSYNEAVRAANHAYTQNILCEGSKRVEEAQTKFNKLQNSPLASLPSRKNDIEAAKKESEEAQVAHEDKKELERQRLDSVWRDLATKIQEAEIRRAFFTSFKRDGTAVKENFAKADKGWYDAHVAFNKARTFLDLKKNNFSDQRKALLTTPSSSESFKTDSESNSSTYPQKLKKISWNSPYTSIQEEIRKRLQQQKHRRSLRLFYKTQESAETSENLASRNDHRETVQLAEQAAALYQSSNFEDVASHIASYGFPDFGIDWKQRITSLENELSHLAIPAAPEQAWFMRIKQAQQWLRLVQRESKAFSQFSIIRHIAGEEIEPLIFQKIKKRHHGFIKRDTDAYENINTLPAPPQQGGGLHTERDSELDAEDEIYEKPIKKKPL